MLTFTFLRINLRHVDNLKVRENREFGELNLFISTYFIFNYYKRRSINSQLLFHV